MFRQNANNTLRIRISVCCVRQSNFAKQIGVTPSFVSRVVNGKKRLSHGKKREWAKALHCNVSDIFPTE
jgi:transcriptional regulator with XRE-family HTH domain